MVQRDFHTPWQEMEALVRSVSFKLSEKDVQLQSAQEQLLVIRAGISHTLQLLGPAAAKLDKFHVSLPSRALRHFSSYCCADLFISSHSHQCDFIAAFPPDLYSLEA